MAKRLLSEAELRALCVTALGVARLPVAAVGVASVLAPGARANWELCSLSPEPSLEVAEKALAVAAELQAVFDLVAPRPRLFSPFD